MAVCFLISSTAWERTVALKAEGSSQHSVSDLTLGQVLQSRTSLRPIPFIPGVIAARRSKPMRIA